VFPYFLATHLPMGMAGLFMASLTGSAMSMLASDLNCLAAVGVEDFYKVMRPQATDKRRLVIGKAIVAVFGTLAGATGILLAHAGGGALSMWFTVSAIASGGLAGMFLLAFLSSRANKQGLYAGIAACWMVTAWATLTMGEKRVLNLGVYNFTWHEYMIGALGHVTLFVVGYSVSLLFRGQPQSEATLWHWLKHRRARTV